MSLQRYLYDYLNNCDSVRALVDNENGIRRMDRPKKGTYDRCICIGSIIYGAVPGVERRPMLAMSPAISFWARNELEEMGDLTIQRMLIELMKRIVWVGDNGFPAQDCVGQEPQVLVYASEFVGQEIEPHFNEDHQAWTMRVRPRFIVGIPTCLPVADDCSPCIPIPAGDVEGGGSSEDLPDTASEAGTAFTRVQPGQEALAPQSDLYVAHPLINTVTMEANKKPGSIVIAYNTTSLIFNFSSSWYTGIEAITTEHDYWHIGGATEANRIERSTNLWHVRPSVSLANRMADFIITNLDAYFDGVFCDESQGELPQQYLDDYRTADEWIEADLATVQSDWRAMQTQFVFRLKQAFGSSRAVIANTAGKTRPEVDGIWIEDEHVTTNGIPWAMARYEEQKDFWEANSNRFLHPVSTITSVLNVKGGPTLDPVFSIPGLVWPGTEA